MSKPDEDDKGKGVGFGVFVVVSILVVAIVVGYGFVPWNYFGKPQNAAEFGDMFGAVNALFSALAFAGVIYAMLQQQKELRYQFEELQDSRKAMQQAAKAHERTAESQEKTLKLEMLAARPIFGPSFYCQINQKGSLEGVLKIKNHGGIAVNVKFKTVRNQGTDSETEELVELRQVIEKGGKSEFIFELPEGENHVRFRYEDRFDTDYNIFIRLFAHEHESDINVVSEETKISKRLNPSKVDLSPGPPTH